MGASTNWSKSRAETKFIWAMPRPGRIYGRKHKLVKVESRDHRVNNGASYQPHSSKANVPHGVINIHTESAGLAAGGLA